MWVVDEGFDYPPSRITTACADSESKLSQTEEVAVLRAWMAEVTKGCVWQKCECMVHTHVVASSNKGGDVCVKLSCVEISPFICPKWFRD